MDSASAMEEDGQLCARIPAGASLRMVRAVVPPPVHLRIRRLGSLSDSRVLPH